METGTAVATTNPSNGAMTTTTDQNAAELEDAMVLALELEHKRPANRIGRVVSIFTNTIENDKAVLKKLVVEKQVLLDAASSANSEWREAREMEIDGIRTVMATRAIEYDNQCKSITSKADEDIQATKSLIAAGEAHNAAAAKVATKGGKK